MKKNLNIAYLNGAEGMIRRGGASSGGSGDSGSSGGSCEEILYIDTSKFTSEDMDAGYIEIFILFSAILRMTDNRFITAYNYGQDSESVSNISKIAAIKDHKIDGDITLDKYFKEMVGVDYTPWLITKEEFYAV